MLCAVCRVPGLGQGDEQGCVAHRGGAHALRQDEEEGPHYKYSRGHVYCHVSCHVYYSLLKSLISQANFIGKSAVSAQLQTPAARCVAFLR